MRKMYTVRLLNKFTLIAIMVFAAFFASAQNAANYTATTGNTASLALDMNGNAIDMTTGSTQLIASNVDDGASGVFGIGFDFLFMGTKHSDFSVNSNGHLRFGSTTTTSASAFGTAGMDIIAPFGEDLTTHATGNVRFKVVGTAPNRTLVVEYLNMELDYGSTNADATFQLRLYETTGVIEFVYGAMAVSDAFSFITPPGARIGFSKGAVAAANTFTVVTPSTFQNPSSLTAANVNNYPVGVITHLNSAANGSRVFYRFTPVLPNDPTALNFTAVGSGTMTLNWTDASNELGYYIYRSTDGVNYSFVNQLAADVTSSVQTGLSASTTYYWRVYSYSEGALGITPASGSQVTTACGGLAGGTYTVGPSGTYPTLSAAVAAVDAGITGPVVLELQSTYNSGSEIFPIVFAANACVTSTNTVTVRPATGAAGLSISGDNATALLDFNGGDYVTIDGRPGGTGTAVELSVVNVSTSGVTVRFTGDAKNNALRYLDLQGSNNVTPTTATLAGVVYFAGAVLNGEGNDNNTIANSRIHAASGGNPAVGVYSFGTNSSVAAYNDNNTITNTEIFDVFKAGTASTAIKLDVGNNAWSITNNHIYQAAPYTYSAAATHRGIWVTPNTGSISNTASGFDISGNFIGGSGPSVAAPAYTMSGAFNYAFMAMDISVGLGTATSVQNNTIGNISMSSSATATTAMVGINVANGNVNVGTVTGNNIGSQTVTGDIMFTTAANSGGVMGIRVTAGGTINVANNKIGGIDLNGGTTTITTNFTGINIAGSTSANVTNNTVGSPNVVNSINMITASTSGTAGQLNGITVTGGTASTVNGNIVANINSNLAYTGAGTAGVRGILVSTGATSINNNIVRNLSTSTASTASGSNSALVGIAMTSTNTAGVNVTGNTIDSLVLTTSNATAAIQATGLFITGTTSVVNNIEKNFIHSFDFTNANPNIIFTGIDNASGTNNIMNNMIRLGIKPDGTDYVNDNTIRGISSNSTAATNIYHNTVYIGGANVGSNAKNTYAFIRTSTSGTYDIRNNILINNRSNTSSGSGGLHYVLVFNNPASGSATAGVTINNNLYQYTGTDGVFAGYTGTTPPADVPVYVAGWLPSDAASVVGNPQLIAPNGTAATVNLHIHPTNPTPIESGGALIASVTQDFDSEVRSGLTPTDIGADAGNFVILDIAPAVITFTPLGNACTTGDRTITATITDGTGIPVAGGNVPRIYFKQSTAGVWQSAPGTMTSGTATNGVWEFVISSAAIPGGVNNLDVIEYFIIAQDNAGNVGSMPGGADATSVNGPFTTYPTPASYSIAVLNGSYDVGSASASPFTTLTSAASFYSNACITGPVTFVLTDAAYDATNETFPITFNANSTASATNTLTIKPSTGNSVVISGVSASSIIKLNGADYIIIDGSNNNTNTRDLTIANTSTAASTAGIWIASLGTGLGSTNDTIRNTIVKAGSRTAASTYGIYIGGTSLTTTGNDNDNIGVINDSISFAYTGLYAKAATAGVNDNLSVIGNSFGSETAAEYLGKSAIDITYATGANIAGNSISNIIGTITNPTGMFIGTGVTNSTITRNRLFKIHYTGTSGYGGRAMDINTGSATSNLTISNNFIWDIKGDSWSSFASDAIIGIRVLGTTGGLNFYHNSISLGTGSFTGSTSGTLSGALYFASTVTAVDIRNNILHTNLVNTNAAAARTYAIYSDAPASAFTNINYNNYFVEGAQGVLGYIGGSQRVDLAAMQAGFGQNLNSVNVNPEFISPDDLHLQSTSPMDGAGTPVSVTVDIDLEARDVTTPDIGADELPAPVGIDMRPVDLVSPLVVASGCYNTETITVSIKNNSQTVQNLVTNPVTVQVSVTLPSSALVVYSAVLNTGTMAPGAVQNVTMTTPGSTIDMTAPGVYSFEISTSVAGGADVNPGNNTITETRTREALSAGTITSTPESYCVTGGAPVLSTTGATGYSSLQWQQSTTAGAGFTDIPGATTTPYTVGSAITQNMYYRLVATCGVATQTATEIEVAIFNPSVTATTPATRCGTGTVQLGATGSAGTTLNWYTTATGGASVGTGTTFTTPSISSTTTYYVAASNGGAPFMAGRATPQSTSTGFNSTDYGIVFNATQPFTIVSAEVYPTGAAGSVTVQLLNSANTVIATAGPFSIPAGTGTTLAGGATPVTLNLNLNVPVGTNLKLRTGTVNVSLIRDNPVSGWSYPLPIGSVGTITSGWAFGSASTGTYYFFYNLNIATGCESARTAVEATVTPPPALTVTAGATICNNAVHQLQVTSTLGDFDSYIWSPTTGLYTDAAATVPYTGTSASTVYVKNSTAGATTYTLNATNSVSNCSNVATSVVTVMPSPAITSNVSSICNSGTAILSLNPATGYGTGTFQWQSSSDGIAYTDIATATTNTYTTPTLTQTTYYKLILKDGAGATCTEPTITVTVNTPQVTGTTPGSRCGTGSVSLGATGSVGTTMEWFTASTGGTSIGSGTTFNTPSIGSTTTYYVSAAINPSTFNAGKPIPSATTGTNLTTYGKIFTITQPITLNSVDVKSTTGTSITISLYNAGGTAQLMTTGPRPTTTNSTNTITLGWTLAPGTYRLGPTAMTGSFVRENGGGTTYPMPIGSVGQITGYYTSLTGASNTADNYYFVYNWSVTTGCFSPRTAVTATVNTPASNVAGAAGATECGTTNVSGATVINYTDCDPIATITPSGTTPVSGDVTACVTIDATIQTAANGQYYVPRHFDITPATNPATATATVTLYFLQSEFNAYNAVVDGTIYPYLPANSSDATGISNLRITQFHGTGTNPANYTGAAELIDPADANIVWNAGASRWEVTFDVTGFSGFYAHTRNFVLPVTGLELRGDQPGSVNRLAWKTVTEINNLGFELQRSADGINYTKLAFIASKGENGNSTSQLNYQFNDEKPFAGNNYYRLKQMDKDGKFSFSNVVLLNRKLSDITITRVYPNPVERDLKLVITSPKAEKVMIIITDLTGKVVMQSPSQLIIGENQHSFDVRALSAGTYLIKAVCGSGCEASVHRFVKQ